MIDPRSASESGRVCSAPPTIRKSKSDGRQPVGTGDEVMKKITDLFEKIKSFEIVALNTSGMRYITDYEIVMRDGNAEVSRYAVGFRGGEKVRQLEKRAVCEPEKVIELLNKCRLISWDGFNGKHPIGVKDGTMFTLKATVNEGKKIYASGSQNFPPHYHDLTDGLYEILREGNA